MFTDLTLDIIQFIKELFLKQKKGENDRLVKKCKTFSKSDVAVN